MYILRTCNNPESSVLLRTEESHCYHIYYNFLSSSSSSSSSHSISSHLIFSHLSCIYLGILHQLSHLLSIQSQINIAHYYCNYSVLYTRYILRTVCNPALCGPRSHINISEVRNSSPFVHYYPPYHRSLFHSNHISHTHHVSILRARKRRERPFQWCFQRNFKWRLEW